MKAKVDFVTNSSSTSFIIVDMRENKDEPIWVEDDVGTRFNLLILEDELTSKQLGESVNFDWFEVLHEEEVERCKELVSEKNGMIRALYVNDQDLSNIVSAGLCTLGIEDLKMPENVEVIRGAGGY